MKSQLDSLEILVEAKSSLEKNLDHHKKLLQEKEGKVLTLTVNFSRFLCNSAILIIINTVHTHKNVVIINMSDTLAISSV